MPVLRVNDAVELAVGIPELQLRPGEQGVICSVWCAPVTAYEVEFTCDAGGYRSRALVMAEQVIPRRTANPAPSDAAPRPPSAA